MDNISHYIILSIYTIIALNLLFTNFNAVLFGALTWYVAYKYDKETVKLFFIGIYTKCKEKIDSWKNNNEKREE